MQVNYNFSDPKQAKIVNTEVNKTLTTHKTNMGAFKISNSNRSLHDLKILEKDLVYTITKTKLLLSKLENSSYKGASPQTLQSIKNLKETLSKISSQEKCAARMVDIDIGIHKLHDEFVDILAKDNLSDLDQLAKKINDFATKAAKTLEFVEKKETFKNAIDMKECYSRLNILTKLAYLVDTSKTQSVTKKEAPVESLVMDVPDDGNCLFYAIGVGLQKKYANEPKIQDKLKWEVKPEQLTGDLSKAVNLLEAPGKKLREQAAGYLKTHQSEDEIMLALMEGVGSHLEVVRKKIEEEEGIIPILQNDIKTLKGQSKTANVQKQLQEKQTHLGIVQKSVQYQKDNLPNEDDLAGYIEATEKDHIYSGVAQLMALSKEYNVPIRVIYNYGKGENQQYVQTFNEKLAKQDHPMPILTIAHVNGNHFQFVND